MNDLVLFFVILVIVFVALVFKYKYQKGISPAFMQDFKDAVRPGLLYVISVMAMMAIYYGLLSNDIQVLRQARVVQYAELIDTDEELAAVKKQNPQLAPYTREQILEQNRQNIDLYMSLQSKLVGSLLALVLTAVVYAVLAVFFWRALVKR